MPISSISNLNQDLYLQKESSIENQNNLLTDQKSNLSRFAEHLMVVAGPSRFGANAITFSQLDRSINIINAKNYR